MQKFHIPQRSCISCRLKDAQTNLLRLSCVDLQLTRFGGSGRSFYLCYSCVSDEKRVAKSMMRQCKSPQKDELLKQLKEIIIDE